MARLFIAEKPSLAKVIAVSMGISSRGRQSYTCKNGDEVTWLFGHLVGLKNPDEYDPALKRWTTGSLPFIPAQFEKKPTGDKSAQQQLKAVLKLIKTAKYDTLVNAGDPGREGQLLVDEVIDYAKSKKPSLRFWTNSLSDEAVAQAIKEMKDNRLPQYVNLSAAGEARSRADWVIGLNLTRAATLRCREYGMTEKVVSVGRVQSPTLSLIVARDNEIDNFVSSDYLIPTLSCDVNNLLYKFTWQASDTDSPSFDSSKRLIDRALADKLVTATSLTVLSSSQKEKKTDAPMPYSLSALQKQASSRFGFTAKQTLDICQSLYESKHTTYPRSDSRYLPEDIKKEAPALLSGLASRYPLASKADPTRPHRTWNTKKVNESDHYAIIPTTTVPKSLGPDEEKLYNLICIAYIQLFLPPQVSLVERIVAASSLEGVEQQWVCSTTLVKEEGWKQLSDKKDSSQPLSGVSKGDVLPVSSGKVDAKKTTPPARFNDGSLIEAMNNIHAFVTDKAIRAQLKENQGIGTEATRSSIIELLVSRKFIHRKGKSLISSDYGKEVDVILPDAVKDPGMTAMWETYLKSIEQGKADVAGFYDQLANAVKGMTTYLLSIELEGRERHLCPECNDALIRLESKKKKGSYFWICSTSREHPILADKEGKPGEAFTKK